MPDSFRAMRLVLSCVSVPLLLLATAAACSAPRPDTPRPASETPPAPAAGLTAAPERRVFTLINEAGDTISTDVYTRTAEALEGEIRIHLPGAKFQRARYRVEFDSEGRAVHAKLTFLRASTPTGEPALGGFTAVLHPDGSVEEAQNGGTAVRYQAGAGVVPWFAPSTAMMQEIIRRAHRLTGGRGRVEVPHFPLASRGQGVGTMVITFVVPDSVEVSYGPGSRPARHPVDAQGRLLSMRTAEGRRLTVRTP
ncbi:MAG: hypothetical protein H0X52_09975 [Gemmatimonadetes bacterium]|nr:hypothetical protein [Gemmatimonadota bacterium]